MTTKNKILELLIQNQGNYISGEYIGKSLDVSRTAIWKAINTLKKEGFEIESSTKKGYLLSNSLDVLSRETIKNHLEYDLDIETFSEIDSTNTYIKNAISPSLKEGFCAISEEQIAGKGRKGRSFYSPKGTGVYFSILLRPDMADKTSNITTMAAVSVCEAIEKLSNLSPKIKWVNDIYLDNKKICGILTEASFDLESGLCEYAILGIGINVYFPKEGFPKEIKDVAGAIFENNIPDTKSKLVAYTLNSFLHYYYHENSNEYIDEYKKRCFVIGRNIDVIFPNEKKKAIALDLDNDCHLIVKYEDGNIATLSSGEVSIKPN